MKEKSKHRLLIVSKSDSLYDFLIDILPRRDFEEIYRVTSAGEASRFLNQTKIDLMIINTPLPDQSGIDLALDFCDEPIGILLLTKNEQFDFICDKVEDFGVFTLAKPLSKQSTYAAIKLLCAYANRLERMEQKTKTLKDKMADIKLTNRAKLLLVEKLGLSESDAHHLIEKDAMDKRISIREAAADIIIKYEDKGVR